MTGQAISVTHSVLREIEYLDTTTSTGSKARWCKRGSA
jgi:hypothetical protein